MEKEFFIIRHGESMGNVGLDPGFDPSLTPRGRAQAAACGEFLAGELAPCNADEIEILSSPFQRAVMTAENIAVAMKLRVRLLPALHEYFPAEWFPLKKLSLPSLREIAERHPLVSGSYPDVAWWPDHNEDREAMMIRIGMLRNRLLGNEFKADKLICVGHWASVAALCSAIVPEAQLSVVDNAAVTQIRWHGNAGHLVRVNDRSFLDTAQ